MFSLKLPKIFGKTKTIVTEAYRGASKMGKGKKLKAGDVSADFQKFENLFFQDSHVFGIVTCIADSMSEAGLTFVHRDRDLADQANSMVSEYEMNTMVSELTLTDMVFGNAFTVLDPDHPDFDFLEQLSPKSVSVNKDGKTGRLNGWKFQESGLEAELTRDKLLHIPINRLAGSTWGTSPLQPLTRILELKGNIEVNLDHLVTRYLVPRYVYLLGREGTSVPQPVIDEFTESLADPAAAQDQVFENNLKIETLGTQYKALHVGYILDYIHQSVYTGLAFPDSFHVAKGSTESTSKVQAEIFNKKRIGGLQRVYTAPVKQILAAIFDREDVRYDKIPEPKWGQLSGTSLESKVENLVKLAGITDSNGNRVMQIPELRNFLKNELGVDLTDTQPEQSSAEGTA